MKCPLAPSGGPPLRRHPLCAQDAELRYASLFRDVQLLRGPRPSCLLSTRFCDMAMWENVCMQHFYWHIHWLHPMVAGSGSASPSHSPSASRDSGSAFRNSTARGTVLK